VHICRAYIVYKGLIQVISVCFTTDLMCMFVVMYRAVLVLKTCSLQVDWLRSVSGASCYCVDLHTLVMLQVT